MMTNTNNGALPTTPTTTAAPAFACLWSVDAKGVAIGKPHLWNEPLATVQAAYRELLACGTPAASLRITAHGQRPDSLGYRR